MEKFTTSINAINLVYEEIYVEITRVVRQAAEPETTSGIEHALSRAWFSPLIAYM